LVGSGQCVEVAGRGPGGPVDADADHLTLRADYLFG
jgi:hypothetical protein